MEGTNKVYLKKVKKLSFSLKLTYPNDERISDIERFSSYCQNNVTETCPVFERSVPSGFWECKLGDNNIFGLFFDDRQWNQRNTECSLKCDEKGHTSDKASVIIKCQGGKWIKVRQGISSYF